MTTTTLKAGYKMTEIGVIPEDWEVGVIKDLLSITTGSRNTQDRIENGKYPFFVRSQTVERINSYSFDGEAVLTAGDGVGTGKVFHYINGKFDFHQRVYKMSNFVEKLDGFYFYIFFSTNFFSRIMQMTAKSSVDSVRMEMISDMQMPLPSKKEQQAISTVLSDTDELIGSLDSLIAKKRRIKEGAMQELLTGKKRLAGFSGEWEVKKLGEIGDSIIGLTYSPSNVVKHGKLVHRSSNVQNNKLAYHDNVFVNSEIEQKLILKEGDILICVRNGSRELIGKSALIKGRSVGETFGAFMSVFRTDKCSKFVYYLIISEIIQKQINQSMGATINQITNKTLNNFVIPYPPTITEQESIAQILSDMDAEITALEEKREKYKLVKQGLMQVLLTGKIRLI